jgi:hypothetical protein
MIPEALGAAARDIYAVINDCRTSERLDETARLLWQGYGFGRIDDNEATYLSLCIEARRPERRPAHKPLGRLLGRLSVFPTRRYQASPDRAASRSRRRILGGSSALPDQLRQHYPEGQRSVLCVVAGEVKRQGVCWMPIDKIGALAGVCRTTVQTTLREARRLGHLLVQERPQRGRKHLTNAITIIASEWLSWIRRAPSAARRIGFNLSKIACPTKNTDRKEEENKNAFELSGRFGGHRPAVQGTLGPGSRRCPDERTPASQRIMDERHKRWRMS